MAGRDEQNPCGDCLPVASSEGRYAEHMDSANAVRSKGRD